MDYRGAAEQFANTYCWKTPAPDGTDVAFWNSMRDRLLAAEKTIFDAGVQFVEMYGWNDADPAVPHTFYYAWPTDTLPAGTFAPVAGSVPGAGDQASTCAWLGTLKSVRGKPVHFRKYFHRPWIDGSDTDKLEPSYHAALTAFAGASGTVWNLNGLFCNQEGSKAYGPTVNVITGPGTSSPWVTTRTLRRRGERPLSPAKIKSVSDMVLAQLGMSSSATTT